MYEWILAMRRKPIEERRRFVATVSIAVMLVLTAVWFAFFFTGVSKHLTNSGDAASNTAASVVGGFGGIRGPFEKEITLPSFPNLKNLGI